MKIAPCKLSTKNTNNLFGQNNIANSMLLLISFLGFLTMPLYLLPSGAIQIVDFFILLFSVILLATANKSELNISITTVMPFFPYLIWVVIVNFFYIFRVGLGYGYELHIFQSVYPLFIFFIFTLLFTRIMITMNAIVHVYFFLLAASIGPFLIDSGRARVMRESLSFNNPNQLGLYSILLFFMLLILSSVHIQTNKSQKRYLPLLKIIIFVCANYFALLSVSRAALLPMFLLDILFIYNLLKNQKTRYLFIIPVFLMLISIFFISSQDYKTLLASNKVTAGLGARLAKKSLIDVDNLSHRTIGRSHQKLDLSTIFGQGGRKTTDYKNLLESHNTFLSIYDTSGVFGLLIFLAGLVWFLLRFRLFTFYYFSLFPLLIYHMAHNAIRFRLGWVSLALLSVVLLIKSNNQNIPLKTDNDKTTNTGKL